MLKIGIVSHHKRDSEVDYLILQNKFLSICEENHIDVKKMNVMIVSNGYHSKFVEELAKELGLSILIHYPNRKEFGENAYLIANTSLVRDCDILIAMVISERTGNVEDAINKMILMHKPVIVI